MTRDPVSAYLDWIDDRAGDNMTALLLLLGATASLILVGAIAVGLLIAWAL